jgi:ribonuclease H / adenosylcobalamin/alpha-ribazole phosphatase
VSTSSFERAQVPLAVVVNTDGGARGNPGPAGWGAVVTSTRGEVLAEAGDYLGTQTNNVAEYEGVIGGLRLAREAGATSVRLRADSKLAIEQLRGAWKLRTEHLRPLHARAIALMREFPGGVQLQHVPRERNKAADGLANLAMDLRRSVTSADRR